ncbi:hypothetical protein NC796_05815 [Aliifodinibius sp. S!AR15-10]|uniref:PEP/pyruvate-binding domain-containing protein n=1 Tax=Aliifodinibius sp. S!AR15-10 TaxID=2950437 RepID=UPI00285A1B5B|nr:PEP/pyruvate-binding domain-containing protein [Aliifodinibius sp. S!AR15-10]MDR8390644.1 hypothetical protein [Aliifodinibius sp. S!AR15-10]
MTSDRQKLISTVTKYSVSILLLFLLVGELFAQQVDGPAIRKRIEAFKEDPRGPYRDLRWFCPDGSVVPPQERCPQGGGKQRARYKDDVLSLQKSNHIYLGQILATTDYGDFWDTQHNHSRLKQYQLEKYLRSIDNGWILRRAQYYRGAVQAEDEEVWGREFFSWLLSYDEALQKHYFLIRQALKDIPHQGDENTAQLMRSQSKVISDQYPPFMDLRVKIHGQPQQSDIGRVESFRKNHSDKLSQDLKSKIDELITTMQSFFQPVNVQSLREDISTLSPTELKDILSGYAQKLSRATSSSDRISVSATMLLEIRERLLEEKKAGARLTLLDISNKLEELVYKEAVSWQPENVMNLLQKTYYLGRTAAATGYIEMWEWERVSNHLAPPEAENMTIEQLNNYLQLLRSQVEWGAGTVKATYHGVAALFSGFEPLANGFIDDRIRSSVLLPLGQSVSRLGDFIAEQTGLNNSVMGIANQSHIRGLNPGFAYGELVVVDGDPDDIEVSGNKIYVFERPPADLKPVAGIATVSEGNLVSHVQLLARNLGIPNAVISNTNLEDLKALSGKKVFYAVSNRGTVIMKPEEKMTDEERELFTVRTRSEERIRVPVDNIRLDQTSILNLRDVKASDSGKLSGPKAANLGQLKQMFPDKVVEGLVIPFGIFREHMEQQMPGRDTSYWQFLNGIFAQAEEMRRGGASEEAIETHQLAQLEVLREAIKKMPLLPSFNKELEDKFSEILGSPLGELPVFIRSDTNMEDLKDFTGAGLNLTVFNVVDKEKIIQGIKDVWASPYTERSYKWRQRYLLNPENVYPSLLIIPSVDVDYSGVLITKGIGTGNPDELTLAFSQGAGGAVDGQVAESYIVKSNGETVLLSPSREPYYNRLPLAGGTAKQSATFEQPILNDQNIQEIRELSDQIKRIMPKTPGIESQGPYDVELGFKDNKLWLFQIRPFVENKRALGSEYLESITPDIPKNKRIKLSNRL